MLNKMAQDIREALEDRHGTGLAEHMGTVGTCFNQFLAAEKYPIQRFFENSLQTWDRAAETYEDWSSYHFLKRIVDPISIRVKG